MDTSPPEFGLPTYEEASQHWPVQTRAMAGQVESAESFRHSRAARAVSRRLSPSRCYLIRASDGIGGERIPGRITKAAEAGSQRLPEVKAHRRGDFASPALLRRTGWWLLCRAQVLTTMIDRGIYPDPDYGLNNLAIPESLAHQDYWYRVEFKAPRSLVGRS